MSGQKPQPTFEDDFGMGGPTPPSPVKVTNREKMEILDRYALVFAEDNVFTYNILPILLSKPYLLSKMELFYDRQFEEILRRKSLAAIDFPRVVHDSMKSKFRESKNYFVQSLANVVYSAEKYSNENEVTLFLEFCLKKGENQKLLFYLFLRQHFKILTYTTFLSHFKTSQDVSKITIGLDNALDIIGIAFSHEKIAQEKLAEAVKARFAKGSKIPYYDFMVTCMNVRMIYSDLPMLDKAVALYKVTNFAELTSAFGQKNLIDMGTAVQNRATGEIRVNGALVGDPSNSPSRDPTTSARNDRAALKNKDQMVYINPKHKSFYEAVKAEIKPVTDKLVNAYLEKHPPKGDIGDQVLLVSMHVQKKLFFIINAIFGEDRRRFLGILRTDIESNPAILEFWMDLQDLLKETNRMGLINANVASDFLGKVTGSRIVAGQMDFLMNFRLNDIEGQFDTSLDP